MAATLTIEGSSPMPVHAQNGNSNAATVPPAVAVDKANILIVDDRDDKILALEAVLTDLNQNLVKARSGKDALRCLLKDDFAVILLDVAMPGMDGFETASLIRKRPQSEHTPIIFVTSLNDRENHIAQGYSLGAVDYILSPIIPQILRTKVSVFVDLYRQKEQIKQQAERLRAIEEAEHKRELAETVDRLEVETKRNRFFTLAIDMLAIANFDGRFLQINPSWQKILGYSEAELKLCTGMDLIHPEEHAAMGEQLRKLREGQSTYFEGRYRRKDGGYSWLGWTAAPFISEQLIYIFARDITERKSSEEEIKGLNRELNVQIAKLTEINKELEAFNYSISHDLRAPLRSMQGFSYALYHEYGERLDNSGKEYARRIMQSSMYMDTLLHDLLDYSRLTRSELEPTPVYIEALLNEILAESARDLDERKAKIDIERPLTPVMAHLPTLRQILSNLISNALKFVAPGTTPRICISTVTNGQKVRIWVKDNGIGIVPEHHQRIFNLFERLHTVKEFPGTGVGLALVRKGVERMGGCVGVESVPGEGSQFWIELPMAATT